jgi:uncharacterized membrane protein YgaE (UPF0421/DUF939 family)
VNVIFSGLQLAIRASLSGGIALALASFADLAYPIYAFIAAVVVTDLSPRESRQLGMRQIIGTIAGASCGLLLSLWLPQKIWAAAFGVLIAMSLCTVVKLQSGSRLAGFTCGIIVAGSQGPAWEFAFFRLLETVIGVTVAWIVSWIPKVIRQES